MKSRKVRHRLAFGAAISFAAGLGQLSGCAEGTQQEIADAAPDIVYRRGGSEGGAEGGVTCTADPCVIDVAAGGANTCALISDGTVRCWGDNAAGELGSGGEGGAVSETAVPIAVPGAAAALRVSAGAQFATTSVDYGVTCAGTAGGPLCWGSNQYGMLGRGGALTFDAVPHPDPAAVTGFTGDAIVALGQLHACALLGTSMACWGSNTYQQLGSGLMDGGGPFATPISVTLPAGKKPIEMALGFAHTCVILDDQSVACWGYNGEDECGIAPVGSNYYQSTPYVVPGVTGAAHVTAGSYHTCVITSDGKVQCWGYNYQGLLGNVSDGGYATPSPLDITMPGGKKAVHIAAGSMSTCALLDDGTVACWGYNTYGQVGLVPDGSAEVVTTPTLIAGVSQAQQITMGSTGEHVCALIFGGAVKCWGANNFGQLGATSSDSGAVGAMSAIPLDVQF